MKEISQAAGLGIALICWPVDSSSKTSTGDDDKAKKKKKNWELK